MFSKKDYDLAERLYTPTPSTIVVTPNNPHPLEIRDETQESRVTGGEYVHELLDDLLESSDYLTIRHGTRAYMDWLAGKIPLDFAISVLNQVVWGGDKDRYPNPVRGAMRLVYRRISKADANRLVLGMNFPGVLLHNNVEGDMDYGSFVHISTEGGGGRYRWGSTMRTIARLIVGAYGLNFTLNVESMTVTDEFMGLTFEEKFGRPVTPWDRVGDSTTIELN